MNEELKNGLNEKNLEKNLDKEVQKEKKMQDDTFNMVINSELKKQFNIKCIENNTMMSKVLKDYIEIYVNN